MNRRRFLQVSASFGISASAAASPVFSDMPFVWSGVALGANARIVLNDAGERQARRLIDCALEEIEILEDLFSLFRSDSVISCLNAEGVIHNPPKAFLELLSIAGTAHKLTGGRFDPTIQPVWQLMARTCGLPDRGALESALALTGFEGVHTGVGKVAFARPGMAITLNGIAQGYATDRIAYRFRELGARNVLVNLGEIAAIGPKRPGVPWRVAISEREDGPQEDDTELDDMAIATSAPSMLAFGHIIDPLTGTAPRNWRRVSVKHRSAAMADALSTAFCLMEREEMDRVTQLVGCSALAV